ncbi:unnamed protein product [Fraxinus pennsylvanica]|uniref:HTH OST-type domain-containing protein n=1 Tax=Fraxinus pennsylvanica TaxID=56036 RepID=A0AAD2DSS4_9LAMI|nr:unnamed protein product [Fraxinus pennsylvanica]
MGLGTHPTTNGSVTMFSAYGDFNVVPRRLAKGCHGTGVQLSHVPNDAVHNVILVDMFHFTLNNPSPSSILLISGDVEFARALHTLRRLKYTIILVIPSKVGVPSALSNAANFLWDWSSLAHGQGFLPRAKTVITRADVAWFPVECSVNESIYSSKSYYNARNCSMISESISECYDNSISEFMTSRSQTFTCTLDKVSAGELASSDQNESTQVPPIDLNVLRRRLVKLLELSGGGLPLIRLPVVYHKMYGRSLCVSEYGASKLVRILKKMDDLMTVRGKDRDRVVFLRNSKSRRA